MPTQDSQSHWANSLDLETPGGEVIRGERPWGEVMGNESPVPQNKCPRGSASPHLSGPMRLPMSLTFSIYYLIPGACKEQVLSKYLLNK
jgi:hypothetical protein